MTINYNNEIWHAHDNSIWVTTEEPYWIPVVLDDGASIFVFTNVAYCHENDCSKYNFTCKKITNWHQT